VKKISIVAPCFNEEEGLGKFIVRLEQAVLHVPGVAFTILLVDDGSSDATWELIRARGEYGRVPLVGVRLTRNFGHQNAIWAGMSLVRHFDAIVTIDADLQDPPEIIDRMVQKWLDGAAVVTGVRLTRPRSDGRLKTVASRFFYRVLGALSPSQSNRISRDSGDFRLLDRRVAEVLLELRQPNLYLRGTIPSLGFPEEEVTYEREPRVDGATKFSLRKMAAFAGFALSPVLRDWFVKSVSILGLLGLVLFCVTGVYAVVSMGSPERIPGWTSTILLVSLFGSVNLFGLSVLGTAMRDLQQTVSKIPKAVIGEVHNLDKLNL
jgi:glycosyltransferase involved in cell wall biosynthesis